MPLTPEPPINDQSHGIELLMDVNYTNNSKTLEPKGEAAAMKWSVKWMIWLQDALLSWAALA